MLSMLLFPVNRVGGPCRIRVEWLKASRLAVAKLAVLAGFGLLVVGLARARHSYRKSEARQVLSNQYIFLIHIAYSLNHYDSESVP